MRKRCSNEEQQRICEEWKQSGLKQAEFCRENNISYKSLSRWLAKLKNNSYADDGKAAEAKAVVNLSGAVKFLPIGNIVPNKSFVEVTLPNGINCKAHLSEEKLNNFLWRLLTCK